MTEIRLGNRFEELPRMERVIDAFARAQGLDDERRKTLKLVLEELVTNVMRHGYDDDAEHEIVVRLGLEAPAGLAIEVEDDGRAFDPSRAPIPARGQAKGERDVGGRGIGLVRSLVDALHYERRAGRNVVMLTIRGVRRLEREGEG